MSDGTIYPARVSIRGKTVIINGHVFTINKVAGDGDCLFHCFDKADSTYHEPRGATFFRRITNTPEGEWGDHDSINEYVRIFKRCVCVVIPGKAQSFVEIYNANNTNDEIVLLFRHNHFDLLTQE